MIKAYKLFTGPDGHSDVITGSVAENQFDEALAIRFKETPAHSNYDWHTAPTTQYVLCLTGTLEFECHSGLKFILRPGEVLIAMDTAGSGHKWHLIDDQPWKRAYVLFKDDAPINFLPD
jgi:quercetin dioxygenase-like cupin family protein